jgi:hypothetical protein
VLGSTEAPRSERLKELAGEPEILEGGHSNVRGGFEVSGQSFPHVARGGSSVRCPDSLTGSGFARPTVVAHGVELQ